MKLKTFYKLAYTPEGIDKIHKTFDNLNNLKQYYKLYLDFYDIENWDEIIYIPTYAKLDLEGEILKPTLWDIYTFLDFYIYANKKPNLPFFKNKKLNQNYVQNAINIFDSLNGQVLFTPYNSQFD